MPASKNISTYGDVKQILDAAINTGEACMYSLPSPGKATHWRLRAYTFIKLYAAQPGLHRSPYEGIRLAINEANPCVVHITFWEVEGKLTTASGKPVDASPAPDPGYVEEAKRVAIELGLEVEPSDE